MALINCPECGKEGISSTAIACPNCGYDIRGWQQRLEDERISREKEERAQENLRMQAEQAEAERQHIISTIPDPTMYGKIWVYAVIVGIGVLFAATGSFLWLIVAAIGCGAYFANSYLDYQNWLKNPEAYKLNKAAEIASKKANQNSAEVIQPTTTNSNGALFCPRCGCEDITKQVFQENLGSKTITHTTSRYRERGHGCLWWLLIGWWWWAVDLFLWIFAFIPRLIIGLFAASIKRKRYKGRSTSVSQTVNDIRYRTMCTCQKCGNTWSF